MAAEVSFPAPLVSTEWLERHLGEAGLVVVDGSWRMPGQGDARTDHERRHIPGAVFFDIDAVADRSSALPHMLAPADIFERAVGEMGIGEKDRVVVYDDQGLFSAARVWWNFRAMGHERVALLDGGLPKWAAEGRPVTDERMQAAAKPYRASPQPDWVIDAGGVRAALADPDMIVLDARPAGRFEGADPEPRPGLRRGRMPGAKSLPASALVGADGTLKPREELARLFAGAGAQEGKCVITTCGSGVAAAILSLALEALGHERCRLYDGSWTEWGDEKNDPALFPVEAGAR